MRKLWWAFTAVVVVSFSALGWLGVRIYQQAPPIPREVVTTDGTVVIPAGEIEAGQNVWQSMGGMEMGSIWGHGSYLAPDWTADWLHREVTHVLDEWAQAGFGTPYARLPLDRQAELQSRVQQAMKTNAFDAATGVLRVDPARGRAFDDLAAYYADVFANGRTAYAIPAGTLADPTRLRQLAAFFFWTSWAASTNRPGDVVTYTSNWPHEPLVGNVPTGEAVV